MGLAALYTKLFEPSEKSAYLAFFRVYVAVHVIFKIINVWPYLDILYSPTSFVKWGTSMVYGSELVGAVQENYLLFHAFYLVLAGCMVLGIGRNLVVALVFLLTDIMQSINGWILDGGDNLLKFQLFYLIFCNSFQHFCLKKSGPSTPLGNLFTNLSVFSIIGHLLLVYFVSGVSKMHSDVWYNGVAAYYTLAANRFRGTDLNLSLVQSSLFVTVVTYATVLWEVLFPCLIWVKKLRLPLLAFGVVMHLSIFHFMMIQEFQLLFIFTYGFFFTNTEWRALGLKASGAWQRFARKFHRPELLKES